MFLTLNFNQNVIFGKHKIRVNFEHLKGFFFSAGFIRAEYLCNAIKQTVSNQ